MDGMLSQDEINALLNGMDLSAGAGSEDATQGAVQTPEPKKKVDETLLTETERDAVGEVANISMGSSATTLYSLVNRKVNITTPVVTMANWQTVMDEYERPCVFIQIKYTQGLDGTNILVLKEEDVKIITDLMMGGDGTNTEGELGELHLSAISEAMNQMMGSSATSLSTMLGTMIDISPPEASRVDLTTYHDGGDISPFLGGTFVKIAFSMQIGDLVDSTIMQLYPVDFAKKIVETFITQQMGTEVATEEPAKEQIQPEVPGQGMPPQGAMGMQPQQSMPGMNMGNPANMGNTANAGYGNMQQAPMGSMGMQGAFGMDQQAMQGMNPMMYNMGMPPQGMMGMQPQMAMNGMAQMYMPPQVNMQQGVNVQPAQFQNFSNDFSAITGQENIGLIKDVPLEVTVELGRTTKSIADILDFAPGTIIELDRIAGEPIDVLVNGKYVARGEVVVIEESFGIRVTEIIK